MAAETAGVAVTTPTDVGLKRELGLIGATWASETSIIGSGWLFGALFAAQAVGGAAIIAWLIAGVVVIVLALAHAELGAMYPVSGGTARFPHFAFGSVAGVGFGFFSYVQAVTIAPIECFAFMQYASYYWPSIYDSDTKNVTGVGFILTIILMAIFVAVNFLAMRIFARVNNVVTWWKVAVPVLAIIVLLTQWHSGNFTAGGVGFMPGGIKALFGALPAAGIIFAYSGFEQCDQLAGEIKNPGRNLPLAIIISVLIGTVIYCLLQLAFIVALPPALVGAHGGLIGLTCPDTGTCNPSIAELNAGPFAAVAVLGGVAWLAHILRIDAFVSPSGTGLIYTTGTSRVSYGLARNRYFPQIFGRVSSNGIPWVGLIAAFIIGLFFLLPFPSWHSLVGLITGASVLMYAGAPLSVGAFRGQVPDADRPYRMPAASILAPAAFIVANLLIYWSGFEVIWKLGVVLVIGYVIIGIFMAMDPQRPPLDWKSAIWLPVWLIGMGIISWQGQYSGGAEAAPVNTSAIPFWWDMLVVAAFSVVIYLWAMRTKLPREEMLLLVNRQHGEEELPEAPRH
ncbi:MAG TPA: APC family permease [Streptosporangiaceae bacterium]|jgi:amino acid transporter|nr:APC family permease [Streptosporangiaceae bacterium]